MLKATVKNVKLSQLFLDPNNYRLINDERYEEVKENEYLDDVVQKRTLGIICGQKNENIKDLLDSFRTNNYLPVDQIQVRAIDEKSYIVLEGNRRTAALKVLEFEFKEKAINLGNFDKEFFNSVPVVIYEGTGDEIQHLIVMGLKHISGNKKWGEWNQSRLIRKLYDSGKYKEEDICKSIGIDKTSLRRNLRASYLIDQYKDSDYGDQFTESMYPIFREVITYPVIRNWLGWNESTYHAENEINKERFFALLSKYTEIADNDGKQTKEVEPAITKREEIRTFAKFIEDENAVEYLEEKRNIAEAYNMSKSGVKEQLQQPIQRVIDSLDKDILTITQLQISKNDANFIQRKINKLQNFIDEKNSSNNVFANTDIFYTHIKSHFNEVKIDDYKCLKEISFSDLKRINIFAGSNNSGKTTLLEAIYLLCYQNTFAGLNEIIRLRGKTPENKMDSQWFVEQIPKNIEISGIFDGIYGEVTIKHFYEDTSDFDSTGYIESINLESVYDKVEQSSKVRIFDNKERSTISRGNKILCPVVFSSPFFLNEPYRYSIFYSKAVKTKLIEKILSFIRSSVLPNMQDIRLVDELQRFRVLDNDFKTAMDLSSYGEGIQRIFFISLLFASAENGVLLIDEIENAIHVELLGVFAQFIEQLALEFNVQVFFTSHSKECIDSFVYNIKDLDSITYTSLIKQNGNVTAKKYLGKEYKRLVKISDTDLRTIK